METLVVGSWPEDLVLGLITCKSNEHLEGSEEELDGRRKSALGRTQRLESKKEYLEVNIYRSLARTTCYVQAYCYYYWIFFLIISYFVKSVTAT